MGLYLQGKLQYYFQPNLCLTFSVPFPLFYAFLQTQKSRNPILSIREQITRSHHFIALPKDYQASIGLTWQIIKKDKGK
ncbi:MAG: hypothetical protein ACKVTZ_17640 [Bacteroidia bacterium]